MDAAWSCKEITKKLVRTRSAVVLWLLVSYLYIIDQRDHGIKLFLGDTQLMRTDRKLAVNGVHDFKGFTGTGAAREFCLPGFTNREGRWGEGRFAAVR